MALVDTPLPGLVVMEPFPVPATARRRRVVGIDVWVESRPAAPSALEPALVSALNGGHCRLAGFEAIEGVLDGAAGTTARCRILTRRDDAHLTDEGVVEALTAVASVARWSVVRKLEEFDGIPGFTPLTAPVSD